MEPKFCPLSSAAAAHPPAFLSLRGGQGVGRNGRKILLSKFCGRSHPPAFLSLRGGQGVGRNGRKILLSKFCGRSHLADVAILVGILRSYLLAYTTAGHEPKAAAK